MDFSSYETLMICFMSLNTVLNFVDGKTIVRHAARLVGIAFRRLFLRTKRRTSIDTQIKYLRLDMLKLKREFIKDKDGTHDKLDNFGDKLDAILRNQELDIIRSHHRYKRHH